MIGLPIEQYPNLTPPIVEVRGTYTGANAISVEESVATPLEQEINGVTNMFDNFNRVIDEILAELNPQQRQAATHGQGSLLIVAGVFLLLIVGARRMGIRSPLVYLILAIGVWIDVLFSGVHATVAGVLLAMLMPVKAVRDPEQFVALVREKWDALRKADLTRDSMIHDRSQLDAISNLRRALQAVAEARPGTELRSTIRHARIDEDQVEEFFGRERGRQEREISEARACA